MNSLEFTVREGTQEAGVEAGMKLARGADAVWPETRAEFLEGVVMGVAHELSRAIGAGAAAATSDAVAHMIREQAAQGGAGRRAHVN